MSVSSHARVMNEKGIHARPSSEIAKEALRYKSDITIIYNGKTASAKDVLQLIMLELFQGTEVEIISDGEDEVEALNSVKELVEKTYSFD